MAAPAFFEFPASPRYAGKTTGTVLTGITLEGSKELADWLEKLGETAPQAMGKYLYQEAEKIMTASKQVCPVGLPPEDKTPGTLRSSGHVQLPVVSGTTVSVTLGYGGEAQAYALAQHERLDYRHRPGQTAKYLERPALEAVAGMEARIASGLKRDLESRGRR